MDREEQPHLLFPYANTHLPPFAPPPDAPVFWDQSFGSRRGKEAVVVEQVQIERRTYTFPQLHHPAGIHGVWNTNAQKYLQSGQNIPCLNNFLSTWIYPKKDAEAHGNTFKVSNNGMHGEGTQVMLNSLGDRGCDIGRSPKRDLSNSTRRMVPVQNEVDRKDEQLYLADSNHLQNLFPVKKQRLTQHLQNDVDKKPVQSNSSRANHLSNIQTPVPQEHKNILISTVVPSSSMDTYLPHEHSYQVLTPWEQHLLQPVSCPSQVPDTSNSKCSLEDQNIELRTESLHDKELEERGWLLVLQKELRNSDVNSLGRIVLPKKDAERNLPPLIEKDGILMLLVDMEIPRIWEFKYRFWPNNKSRMYIMENTGEFVKSHNLKTGDFFIIYRDQNSGNYIARAKKVERASASTCQDPNQIADALVSSRNKRIA